MAVLGPALGWFALAIWLGITTVVLVSYVQGLRRTQVQATGRTTVLLRSPWLMAPLLVVYLVVLVLLWRPIVPAGMIGTRSYVATLLPILSLVGTLLLVAGAVWILWGRFTLGRSHNISSVTGVQLFADHRLVTTGAYALVRHPMYLGFALSMLGTLLIYRTWSILFIAVHGLVFVVRARREEEALAATFGREWQEYCRRVPAIIPSLRGRLPVGGKERRSK
jgi:protein-S-isoprenylcysteine O-methyltransferase Ste14